MGEEIRSRDGWTQNIHPLATRAISCDPSRNRASQPPTETWLPEGSAWECCESDTPQAAVQYLTLSCKRCHCWSTTLESSRLIKFHSESLKFNGTINHSSALIIPGRSDAPRIVYTLFLTSYTVLYHNNSQAVCKEARLPVILYKWKTDLSCEF